MISNPRHGSPPRLMAHQPTRCSTTQESSIRVHRPDLVSRFAGWCLGGRGARAAGLRHLVSGLIEALGQRGELLLRHPKLASRVGPTLHDPAVFEARRAELG